MFKYQDEKTGAIIVCESQLGGSWKFVEEIEEIEEKSKKKKKGDE